MLYHFTCDHGARGIAATHTLQASVQPFMPSLGPLLWLTDLAEPTQDDVGLTSTFTSCDRLAHRYRVQTKAAVPWATLRDKAPFSTVSLLERYGKPEHWWVARRSLTASEFCEDSLERSNG